LFTQESKRLLTEASLLLSHEPETLPEGKIAIQAKKNLIDLKTVLQNIQASTGDSAPCHGQTITQLHEL
jgi:hypothetical protein